MLLDVIWRAMLPAAPRAEITVHVACIDTEDDIIPLRVVTAEGTEGAALVGHLAADHRPAGNTQDLFNYGERELLRKRCLSWRR